MLIAAIKTVKRNQTNCVFILIVNVFLSLTAYTHTCTYTSYKCLFIFNIWYVRPSIARHLNENDYVSTIDSFPPTTKKTRRNELIMQHVDTLYVCDENMGWTRISNVELEFRINYFLIRYRRCSTYLLSNAISSLNGICQQYVTMYIYNLCLIGNLLRYLSTLYVLQHNECTSTWHIQSNMIFNIFIHSSRNVAAYELIWSSCDLSRILNWKSTCIM